MTDQNQDWFSQNAQGQPQQPAQPATPATAAPAAAPAAAPQASGNWFTDNGAPVSAAAPQTGREQSNAAVDRELAAHPQAPENYGFTLGNMFHKAVGGAKDVVRFAADVSKDISDANKPLFFGGAESGQQESTFHKYVMAPAEEQNKKGQEGDQPWYESVGHSIAAAIPLVGPWAASEAEKAGQTQDIGGTVAEVAGQALAGKGLEVGAEHVIGGSTRVAGAVAEKVATRLGASPKTAETIGNIASIGAIKPLDAHMEALDVAVDSHISAEKNFDAANKAAEAAQAQVDANPNDAGAKADLGAAQKDLVKAGAVRDSAEAAVDKIQDNILKSLTPIDWSKLSLESVANITNKVLSSKPADIAKGLMGVTSDFQTALTRFANMAGKASGVRFRDALKDVSSDIKSIINADVDNKIVDPNSAADAVDQHIYQNIENPLQRASGATRDENVPVVDNFRARAEARIDKYFQDNPGKAGGVDEEKAIKEKLLDRVMREQDLGGDVTTPREPNLYEAESIRQGLKQYEPNESNGFRAAAYDLANFMRETIDEGYEQRGVSGVKESRLVESKLIDISKGLRKAQTLFEAQQAVPAMQKIWHGAKAAAYVATLGSLLLQSPHGALIGLGGLWEDLYKANTKDLSGNLARARELAGREPEATATVPDINQQPPTSGAGPSIGSGPKPTPPSVPPPTPPEAAVRPPINHTLNGELAAYFPDATRGTTPDEYNALIDRFNADYQAKLRGVTDFKAKNPDQPLPEGVAEEWAAAKQLKGTIEREGAKEDAKIEQENQKRQQQYQKELLKYQAKNQAEITKAQAETAAKAEQEKAAAEQAEKNRVAAILADKKVAHAPFVNATEPSTLSAREGTHEVGGHILVANAVGLNPTKFLSEFHPELEGTDSHAQVQTDSSGAQEGPVGIAQRVLTHLGGPAWDEVHNNIPADVNDRASGDFDEAKRILREESSLNPRQQKMLYDALYDKAKEIVSNPDAVAIAKTNAALREEGLHNSLHMSENRIKVLNKLFKGVFGDDVETTLGGKRVRKGATDGGVSSGEPADTGAEGTERDGSAQDVSAGSPRAAGEEAVEGKQERSSITKGAEQSSIKKTIPAGGTGAKTEFPDYPLEQRLADLGIEKSNLAKSPKGSSVPLMENPLRVKPGKGREEANTLDLAKGLNQFNRKQLPALEPGSEPKEMVDRAKKIAEDEAKYQLAQSKTGTEWYTTEMKDHDKVLTDLRPELLTGPETASEAPWTHTAKMTLFKAAEAILSSGQKPYANVKAALRAWDAYNETGEFPRSNPATGKEGMSWGPRGVNAYGNAFDYLNRLVSEKGEKGAADWLLSEHPVSELKDYNPSVSGKKTDMATGAMILGEKRGPFMQNLHGIESKFTADMWVSRSWNRWMGTLDLDPRIGDKGKMISESDAPRNNTERTLMKQAFGETADKLGLTTSSLQAVLWYYEQALYRAHGLPVESWSFSDAAKRVGKEASAPSESEQSGFKFGANEGGEGAVPKIEPKHSGALHAFDFLNSFKDKK
jgi:hypothetical protein